MTLTLNFSLLLTSILSTLIIMLITLVAKSNQILNRIVDQIGTNHPPEGILGRVSKLEDELYSVREWAIRNGFDRRSHIGTQEAN